MEDSDIACNHVRDWSKGCGIYQRWRRSSQIFSLRASSFVSFIFFSQPFCLDILFPGFDSNNLVVLRETFYKQDLFDKKLGEGAYACIWSSIIDPALASTDFFFSRGEQISRLEKAYRSDKQVAVDPLDPRNVPKYDGILKGLFSVDPSLEREYGYTEIAKDKQLSLEAKRTHDEFKMMYAMRLSLLSDREGLAEDEWLEKYKVSVFCSSKISFLVHGTCH